MSKQEKEPKFYSYPYGQISYHRVGDVLRYHYTEKVESRMDSGATSVRTYNVQGTVPEEVVSEGEEAIKEFAKSKVEEKVNAEKESDRQRKEYRRNLRYPVELDYSGATLRGIIRANDSTYLMAELLEPYQGITGLNFGFASAMSKHYIFSKDELSAYAIERGR